MRLAVTPCLRWLASQWDVSDALPGPPPVEQGWERFQRQTGEQCPRLPTEAPSNHRYRRFNGWRSTKRNIRPRCRGRAGGSSYFSQRSLSASEAAKNTFRPAPPKVCPSENLGPQGQRRIHGATLPCSPPESASARQRERLAGEPADHVCECVGQPQLHLCSMHLACAKARAARLLCASGIRIAGPPLLL
jgi:hypothetical protein